MDRRICPFTFQLPSNLSVRCDCFMITNRTLIFSFIYFLLFDHRWSTQKWFGRSDSLLGRCVSFGDGNIGLLDAYPLAQLGGGILVGALTKAWHFAEFPFSPAAAHIRAPTDRRESKSYTAIGPIGRCHLLRLLQLLAHRFSRFGDPIAAPASSASSYAATAAHVPKFWE